MDTGVQDASVIPDASSDGGLDGSTDGDDSGPSDGGDAGEQLFYASPVSVDDLWTFDGTADSDRGAFLSSATSFTEGIGGTLGLEVLNGQQYALDNTNLGFPFANRAFTVGGWVRDAQPEDGSTIFSRGFFGDGGWVMTYSDEGFNCVAFDGEISGRASIPIRVTSGVWHHVTCKYVLNEAGGTVNITIVVNGQVSRTSDVAYRDPVNIDEMSIGTPQQASFAFEGAVDDLFFSRASTFGPRDIAKAWACDVDGRLCVCEVANPTDYEDCGRVHPDCSTLAPCFE